MQGHQTTSQTNEGLARAHQKIHPQKKFFKDNEKGSNGSTNKPNSYNGNNETTKHSNKRQKTNNNKAVEMDNFNYDNFRSLNISDSDNESE